MEKSIVETCISCQSSEGKEAIRLHDHLVSKKLFVIQECTSCGFRYIKNQPPADTAYKYYETEEYVEHSDSNDGLINGIYHQARKWMLRYKYRLVNGFGLEKKIIDFGTGTGYFLNFMKQNGYDVTGIEISEKARKFGINNFGLDIYHPDRLFDDSFESGFSYATFWHVLEHIYNADEVLQRLHGLLKDDGRLIVALPNYHCLEEKVYKEYWNGYDVPRHLWHWDRKSFSLFVERQGFRIAKTKMLPLDPFYNCLISESYRKKKLAHILIPFIGGASLLRGWINNDKASSVVYFLEKIK